MLADRYGLSLSTSSQVARDAYGMGMDCILSAAAGAQTHLGRALEADPDFALAHIALARTTFLMAQVPQARTAAARARELAMCATPREQSHVNAIALAIEGNASDALAATRVHVARHPLDAMALAPATGVFGVVGFSGHQQREEELLDIGGSRAQRDLVALTMVAAYLRAGRADDARKMIVQRIERRSAVNVAGFGAH